jgi:hypothetical protein
MHFRANQFCRNDGNTLCLMMLLLTALAIESQLLCQLIDVSTGYHEEIKQFASRDAVELKNLMYPCAWGTPRRVCNAISKRDGVYKR